MSLLDYETALGRLVRQPNAAAPFRSLDLDEKEISRLQTMRASAGFRFTTEVQRSWCVGRATRAVSFTLSILSDELRVCLLDEWTESGGGTSSFFVAEAEAFLEFIASRLTDPSHELTACRFEQATLRANEYASGFTPPDLNLLSNPRCFLRRGRYAAMVPFHGEPYAVIEALVKRQPLPRVQADPANVIFGPGLNALWRLATAREVAIWQILTTAVPLTVLSREGYSRDEIGGMLHEGIVEFGIA